MELLQKRQGGSLMDANKQWRSRPSDEAVFSVDELLKRTKAAKDAAREVEGVAWNTLSVLAQGEDLLLGRGAGSLSFTNYSLGQFCSLPINGSDDSSESVAPAGFLSQLSAQTAALALNERLAKGIGRRKAAQLLASNGALRAVTTDSYERVWDYDLATRIEGLCANGSWQPAEAFKRSGNQEALHAWGEKTQLPLGWVGDRSMFVCLVDYEGVIHADGNTYARFLLLSNSEVGAGALKVTFGLMDFACCNFILWGCHEVYEANLKHTKSIHERWAELGASLTKSLSSDSRAEILGGISAARGLILGETVEQVVAMTQAATTLPKSLVVDAYARAEATPRYGDPKSAWGMLNGLTEASQHVTGNADKRNLIDIKAARLMGLLKR